ncbi:MFS transporter [Hyphobacterium sp.]|uniref:MFS transporter n=1 Tax=Hyphobacterium sp. TaxID=2004662 RepID=UPI003BABE429
MSAKIAASLIGQRRFWPMLAAQSFGAFNDNLFRFSLISLATYSTLTLFGRGEELMNPVAASAFTIAMFLFSAIAGRAADKFDRTRILRFTKFAEIWLMSLAAIGFFLQSGPLLVVTLFFMGMQSAFFAPTKNAALPNLLDDHELVPGNAILSGALNMSILLGIVVGTLLAGSHQGGMIVGGVLVIMAIIGWISIRQLPLLPAAKPDMKMSWNVVMETFRVLRFAGEHPRVLRPLLGVAWFWLLGAAIIFSVMPTFTSSVLGGDQTVLSLFNASFTIGGALGAILCGTLSGRGNALIFSVIGAIGLVIFPVDLALSTMNRPVLPEDTELMGINAFLAEPGNIRILVDLVMSAVSAGLFVVPLQAMAQRRSPQELRGRLLSVGSILNAGAATIGNFMLAAVLALALPIPAAFLVVAIISAAIAAYTFYWHRRIQREGADQTPSPS